MNQTCFQSSDWYRALTLAERIELLHASRAETPKVALNADLAEQRMYQWRSQPAFTTDYYFAQRLTLAGITENEFLYLLGESAESLHNRIFDPPSWLKEIEYAFSHPTSLKNNSLPLPEASHGQTKVGFLGVIEPLINQGRNRLHTGIKEIIKTQSNPPFDPSTIEGLLFVNLTSRLLRMLSRTLVLELNVNRLQGLLLGETSEERFESFLRLLRQRNTAQAILKEYPVLTRQLTNCINQWVVNGLEFIVHLCIDWKLIRNTFSAEIAPGELTHLINVGDFHRGGRSAAIARFSSGFCVVYKPRPLKLDVHFQELLTYLNDRGFHPQMRTLKILDRGPYGWVEYIAAEGCTSAGEIRRFYERQGGYLALLYALEATDFHFENLIAVGEHPVLVDLEGLFHPRVGHAVLKQAEEVAARTLSQSVLHVGLLPHQLWSNGKSEGVDLSGLGAVEGQLTPFGVPMWECEGTDEMRFVRKQMKMQGHKNRPTLNGAAVNLLNYVEAIAAGFTTMYWLILEHRDELLSSNGYLARFADDETRVILRHTQTYSVLLNESFHPDVLRNALDRDLLFDRLWVQVEYLPYLVQVIPAECEDLQEGDIPRFTTRPNSHDLWSGSGKHIAEFFNQTALSIVQQRLQELSEDDLQRQLWFIRASLATLSKDINPARKATYHLTESQAIADRGDLLGAARAIGNRLDELALRGEDEATWIGLTFTQKSRWSLAPSGIDLYDGLPGIALFLAYLGRITHEERYTALARSALRTMQRRIELKQQLTKRIGGFSGWGGIVYTLTHLHRLWNEPALLAQAEELVAFIPDLIEQDECLDIIDGAAGCIASLISLYSSAPSDRILAPAIKCGDRLIACSQRIQSGIGWIAHFPATGPLTGFSHGVAGMAWALLELAALSDEERFRKAALAAINYERSLFSPEVGNWPDLREFETSGQTENINHNKFSVAWCHGAPGIGLARLRSLQYMSDAEIHAEIDTALKTTLEQGFGHNHSLCHGDLGNLELLLQASETFDDSQWHVQLNRIGAKIIDSIGKDGWLCGNPLGVESPGLMTGLAGIGYGLLRIAEPRQVPSVLALAPPLPGQA